MSVYEKGNRASETLGELNELTKKLWAELESPDHPFGEL